MADKEIVKSTIPFPKEIYEKVKKLADKERRSINQQIIYMLAEYEKNDEIIEKLNQVIEKLNNDSSKT